jgi:hypothetical protein
MRRYALMAAVAALAACSSGGGEAPVPADNSAAPETGAAAQVAKLDAEQRNIVFEKAIRAAGATCTNVTRSERAEVAKGVKGWKAECANGNAHLIQILSNGTAKVTSRTD